MPKLVKRNAPNVDSSPIAVTPPIDVPDFDIQLVYRKGKQMTTRNTLEKSDFPSVEIVITAE
ncbi:hypothetical protein O9929_08430 [Vibrio lentus]|nr:hypothetical protein [Vibrio lentus]